ncbi:MAG TPA: alpha/beta fold hydrolase [Amycolatopsis sp.]|uniref:alpha/beta fold hydrolase n=1 Tax=Amycolatopsis sp. TaxID=37632 RepID=UPI002B4A77ED|nr:alpha/beta fold hydrolase [Amycolatopsis sp.]HKS46090.1 alpha/beta fold hydrolase [Amycolatopsis sp.]
MRLSNRLAEATELRLPATLVFDHPSPRKLAVLLRQRPEAVGGLTPQAESRPPGTLVGLLRTAVESGRSDEFMDLLFAVSRFRPAFQAADGAEWVPDLLRLADGFEQPVLVCFPSLLAIFGPHEYARMATTFRARRTVLALPGFRDGEPLPATVEAIVELGARGVLRGTKGAPFALLGHSTGGLLAQATAARLEELGARPAAVVLVDTFALDGGGGGAEGPGAGTEAPSRMTGAILARDGGYGSVDDAKITAPTLLVRAADTSSAGVVGSWPLEHAAVDGRGDHFTVLEEDAPATAELIEGWLREVCPQSPDDM